MDISLDFSKLPKKIQNYIENLERSNNELRDELTAIRENKQSFVSYYTYAGNAKPLGEQIFIPSDKINIYLDENSYITVHRTDRDLVQIYSNTGILCVYPRSSNSLELDIQKY